MGKALPPPDMPLLMCVLCEVCIIITTCFHDPHISRRVYLLDFGVDNAHLPAKVNLAFLMQAEGRFKQAWDLLPSALATNKGLLMALRVGSRRCGMGGEEVWNRRGRRCGMGGGGGVGWEGKEVWDGRGRRCGMGGGGGVGMGGAEV